MSMSAFLAGSLLRIGAPSLQALAPRLFLRSAATACVGAHRKMRHWASAPMTGTTTGTGTAANWPPLSPSRGFAAKMTVSEVQERVLKVCKAFDKVTADKVRTGAILGPREGRREDARFSQILILSSLSLCACAALFGISLHQGSWPGLPGSR